MKQRVIFKRTETRTYDIDSPEGLSTTFLTSQANGGMLGGWPGSPPAHSVDVTPWSVVKAEPKGCCDLVPAKAKPRRRT